MFNHTNLSLFKSLHVNRSIFSKTPHSFIQPKLFQQMYEAICGLGTIILNQVETINVGIMNILKGQSNKLFILLTLSDFK